MPLITYNAGAGGDAALAAVATGAGHSESCGTGERAALTAGATVAAVAAVAGQCEIRP